MFILIYLLFANVLIPNLVEVISALVPSVMACIIVLAGITMILGAVGLKVSTNVGTNIISTLFKGIGYLVKNIFKGVFWIIKSLFGLIPKIFGNIRKFLLSKGARLWLANLIATVAIILFIVILI